MLKPKISSCLSEGCETLTITDITGLYNVNTNLYGWDSTGSVNITKASVTSAILEIQGPGQTTFTSFDVTSAITASSIYVETFPLVVVSFSDITITPNFTDGLYNFIYTITSGGTEYQKKMSVVFTCNAQCCLDKAIKQFGLNANCDCCENVERMKALQLADTLITGMNYAGNCLTADQIDQNLITVKRICNSTGETCCD